MTTSVSNDNSGGSAQLTCGQQVITFTCPSDVGSQSQSNGDQTTVDLTCQGRTTRHVCTSTCQQVATMPSDNASAGGDTSPPPAPGGFPPPPSGFPPPGF